MTDASHDGWASSQPNSKKVPTISVKDKLKHQDQIFLSPKCFSLHNWMTCSFRPPIKSFGLLLWNELIHLPGRMTGLTEVPGKVPGSAQLSGSHFYQTAGEDEGTQQQKGFP